MLLNMIQSLDWEVMLQGQGRYPCNEIQHFHHSVIFNNITNDCCE